MAKRVSSIAPWQAGKLFALIYFLLSLFFVVLMTIATTFIPVPASAKPALSGAALFLLPILYAIGGLILVPLGCWTYNVAAKLVGGLQISVTDDKDA